MFAIISNGDIAKLVQPGTAFEWDGNQYAANWCNLSSPEDKAAIGMVDVVYAARPDERYYWVSENAPAVNGASVEVTYTTTPKDLTALKEQLTGQVRATAYSLLQPTDYMAVRAMETEEPMLLDWKTWRQAIRTTASTAAADISAAVDVAALQQVMASLNWPNDPDYTPPGA